MYGSMRSLSLSCAINQLVVFVRTIFVIRLPVLYSNLLLGRRGCKSAVAPFSCSNNSARKSSILPPMAAISSCVGSIAGHGIVLTPQTKSMSQPFWSEWIMSLLEVIFHLERAHVSSTPRSGKITESWKENDSNSHVVGGDGRSVRCGVVTSSVAAKELDHVKPSILAYRRSHPELRKALAQDVDRRDTV